MAGKISQIPATATTIHALDYLEISQTTDGGVTYTSAKTTSLVLHGGGVAGNLPQYATTGLTDSGIAASALITGSAVSGNLVKGASASSVADSGIVATNVALLSANQTFSGTNTFSGSQTLFFAGSNTVPGLSFSGDTGTGFASQGGGELDFLSSGARKTIFSGGQLITDGLVRVTSTSLIGFASANALTSNLDTAFHRVSAGVIGVNTGSSTGNADVTIQAQAPASGAGRTLNLNGSAAAPGSGAAGGNVAINGGAGDGAGAKGIVSISASNLGIGVTSTPYSFQVGSGSITPAGFGSANVIALLSDTTSGHYPQIAINCHSNGGGAIEFYVDGTATADFGYNAQANDLDFINRAASGTMQFYTHNGTALASRIYIGTTGLVGIGTTVSAAGAQLAVVAPTAGTITGIYKGFVGQTADLVQFQKSDATVYSRVTSNGWIQDTQGTTRLTANVTNATATPINLSDETETFIAGRMYIGLWSAPASNSAATEGLAFTMGGTATFTSFKMAFVATPIGSTVGTGYSTAPGTPITVTVATTATDEYLIVVAFVVNAGGTVIPQGAEVSHTAGTATFALNGFFRMMDSPN